MQAHGRAHAHVCVCDLTSTVTILIARLVEFPDAGPERAATPPSDLNGTQSDLIKRNDQNRPQLHTEREHQVE